MKEDEVQERYREQYQKAGHPLYQPGVKFATRHAKVHGTK